MKITLWGTRGSLAAPGPDAAIALFLDQMEAFQKIKQLGAGV